MINRPSFGGECVKKYWRTSIIILGVLTGVEYKEPQNTSFEQFSEGPVYGRGFNLCFFNNNNNGIHNENDDRQVEFLVKLLYIVLLVMR